MRSALFATLLALAACKSDMRTQTAQIVWMEWPAEVQTFDPFRTRLVVWQPCALIRGFEPSPTADAVSVTFAPYFLVDNHPIYCLDGQGYTSDITVNVPLDTAGTAPGLPFERVYEMRGALPAIVNCPACAFLNSAPWASFGYVTVRPTTPSTTVRNAAGSVIAQRDSVGCTRIRPSGLLGPNAEIVVENSDTTAQWFGFVRGYIYQPAAPVCGATTVFHLMGQY